MILSIFIVSILIFCIYGFSYHFKILILGKNVKLETIDFVYGLFSLVFVSIFLNFFFKIELIAYFVILIGNVCFILAYFKKKIDFSFLKLFLILIFFLLISSDNSPIGDTNFYHLQAIKWISSSKISFGLVNLEERLGYSTIWPNLLAITNIKIFQSNFYYLFNISIYTIFYNYIFNLKIKNYGNIILVLGSIFILFYSLIHPDKNGSILNYLGSIEYDYVNFLFFLISISLFFEITEEEKIHNQQKLNKVLLLSSLITIIFLIKINYLPTVIIFIYIFFKFRKKLTNINTLYFFNSILIFIYFIKNFIISGCLVFPIKLTCLNTQWSLSENKFEEFLNLARAFPRALGNQNIENYYQKTLDTYEWISPWLQNYFLKTSIIQLLIPVFIFSIFFAFNYKVRRYLKKSSSLIILFVLILNLVIFIQSPAIRYGFGSIFILCFFIPSIYLFYNEKLFKIFQIYNKKILLLLMLLLSIKNILIIDKNILYTSLLKKNIIINNIDHSKKEFYSTITPNGYKVYYGINENCFDTKEICVNFKSKNFEISNIYNYLIFKENKKNGF